MICIGGHHDQTWILRPFLLQNFVFEGSHNLLFRACNRTMRTLLRNQRGG